MIINKITNTKIKKIFIDKQVNKFSAMCLLTNEIEPKEEFLSHLKVGTVFNYY